MDNIKFSLIKEEYREMVFRWLSRLKLHSKETYDHSIDVAEKSLVLAKRLGVKVDEFEKLYTASLMHDIGKLYIDSEILHKRDATENEIQLIRTVHVEGTRTILSKYFDSDIVNLATHHHERLDSSGYPRHLGGKNLNSLDRILQVADVTSALEMNRSYKKAYTPERTIAVLDRLAKNGELDRKCVNEIERAMFGSNDRPEFGA